MTTRIITTDCTDPHINLAAEEHLTFGCRPGEVILYLWQNANTVVIGRNQNPWQECRIEEMKKEGCTLARRLSGGGAVYHDLGNLNFTIIARKEDYNIPKQTNVILNAVKLLGIKAEKTGRNDLVIKTDESEAGAKFSGHAYYMGGDYCYHHGTIMVDVDPAPLSRYLSVSKDKLKSKGVKSVRSRVTNLIDHLPDVTISEVREALIQAFKDEYCGQYGQPEGGILRLTRSSDFYKDPDLVRLIEKYSSDEWNYGRKIPFNVSLHERFTWGDITVQLHVVGGIIEDCGLYSDSLETGVFEKLTEALKGKRYSSDALEQVSGELDLSEDVQNIAQDIITLIIKEID